MKYHDMKVLRDEMKIMKKLANFSKKPRVRSAKIQDDPSSSDFLISHAVSYPPCDFKL